MAASKSASIRNKTFGEKLRCYLERKPSDLDVFFIVGPSRENIGALKIALKASAPEIERLFNEKWDADTDMSKEVCVGIPLPDLNPQAFKIFLKLLQSDDWSCKGIEALKLSAETIFNVLTIAKQFCIKQMEQSLVALVEKIHKNFDAFLKSNDFLELSRDNLESIIASDCINVDEAIVFKYVKQWAQYQCTKANLKPNGKNLRQVLGSALFKIRFPLLSNTEFASEVCSSGILTETEELQIFKYIAHSQSKHLLQQSKQPVLGFSTKSRNVKLRKSIQSEPHTFDMDAPLAKRIKTEPNTSGPLFDFSREYPQEMVPSLVSECNTMEFLVNFEVDKKSMKTKLPSQSYDVTIQVFKKSETLLQRRVITTLLGNTTNRIEANKSADIIVPIDDAAAGTSVNASGVPYPVYTVDFKLKGPYGGFYDSFGA